MCVSFDTDCMSDSSAVRERQMHGHTDRQIHTMSKLVHHLLTPGVMNWNWTFTGETFLGSASTATLNMT